jgi:hypothetical protein
MKQILHIFAKDVRLSWSGILGALALVTAYLSINYYLLAAYPQFRQGGIASGGWLAQLLPIIFLLTLIGWIVLVSSVILGERLAGDTQFWITRPYEWKKLLAAKLLYLVIFVYLPALAAFFILRAEVGPPSHSEITIQGLLGNVLLFITVLVLPAAAIATVTANSTRLTWAIFCAITGMIAATVIPAEMRPDSVPGPLSVNICFAVLLLLCGAVIVLQYARRKTRLSVALLIAIPVLIFAIGLFTPERRPHDRTQQPKATVSRPT